MGYVPPPVPPSDKPAGVFKPEPTDIVIGRMILPKMFHWPKAWHVVAAFWIAFGLISLAAILVALLSVKGAL
jgi:hypothetical protein